MSNKTSDKNVATEEDLEVLNEVLLHNRETEQVRIAIEHILAEREQKDKRIQELEEENYVQKIQIYENYIPKQDVIDKIEEISMDKGNRYYYKFLEIRDIQYTIDILRELLEGEK